jgi:hypothetical protein
VILGDVFERDKAVSAKGSALNGELYFYKMINTNDGNNKLYTRKVFEMA